MKKKWILCLCAILTFGLSLPMVGYLSDTISASTDLEPWGEKVVSFYSRLGYDNQKHYAALTESRNLYIYGYGGASKFVPIKQENGELIDQIVDFHVFFTSAVKSNVIALRNDNTLWVSGDNSKGSFGNGTNTDYIEHAIQVDPGVGKIVQVAAGRFANYILTDTGDVYASGDNSKSALGNGTTDSSNTWVKVNVSDVKKLRTDGESNMYALTNDGRIYGWGEKVLCGDGSVGEKVSEPVELKAADGTVLEGVLDIDTYGGSTCGYTDKSIGFTKQEDGKLAIYILGIYGAAAPSFNVTNTPYKFFELDNLNIQQFIHGIAPYSENYGYVLDGSYYTRKYQPYKIAEGHVIQAAGNRGIEILTDTGAFFIDGVKQLVGDELQVKGFKSDDSSYKNDEKYNDDVYLKVNNYSTTSTTITCEVEHPVGSTAVPCTNLNGDRIDISSNTDRINDKYKVSNGNATKEFTVDLYKGAPVLQGFSTTSTNKIKVTDSVSLAVPTAQTNWNSYTATVTDSSNQTKDFTGGTLAEGTYTMHVTDEYGNTQDYRFEVSDKPTPTANFNPANTSLTYGDNATKVNNTVGTFTLQYPAGKPTSNIATIQLGTGGDESHFSVDTTGALKVKGADLDAGTYSVSVSGTDGNGMAFSKTATITVNKKDQNNYQITNNANYPFQSNQEIAITTSGNDSGENETYTITNGNSVAQIVGNKFKLLSAGTFTLQATVAGNTNYNSKTVTKQITVSQLPTQNPPVSITSNDSIMYGDTYTPSYSGGQGSGAVSWTIESDNGTGAALSNGKVTVTGVGTFTIKVTKAGTSSYQASTATKVITVNKRKTIVKPKDVTKTVGQAFKDNGATYNPQPVTGDNIGTLTITSKYPNNQVPGRYTDGIQASGLSNPNYEFEYQEGTLIINSNSLPNNGEGYYKVTGTKGKNNWYISDVEISATGKNGYDEISNDGINFQTTPLVYSTDGDYPTDFYLRNSSTGLIAKAIRYQLKIDQTPPDVPTLSMKEINKSAIARFINALSFGNWMNQAAEVTMTSSDATSGLDYYEYTETSKSGTNKKQSTSGIVTYQNDVELTLQAKACDKAGNCSDLSSDEGIMIDRKAPTITGVKDKSEYKFYYLPRFVKVTDDYSGLSYSEYKLDGAMAGTIQDNIDEEISSVGEYEIYAEDNAGNDITITFKIVPLPDIETEIDGSDESKDIIDQIIDELDEIKDKIDETEKKDIEDWIKDALDKWNSLRKKVVETDDKSAKVEGQGDTDFDPSVILIVDDITDHADDIPPLPRKPITVYDVWLQKGNVKIQPDGSIKVYLPYTEPQEALGDAMGGAKSDAKPIVYEIDTKNKVTELKVQLEGSFVTFITDKLLRYAISNDKQEINKDDTCVVGPDGKPTTGDEVCGLPNDDGKQPVKKPDGSVEVPDGGKIEFPNGTEIETPDGAIIHPDGSVTLPDGTEYDPDGNKKPGKQCALEGKDINIDTDGDGLPDLNLDINGDCISDLNIDTNFDNIPDINIDTKGDGKPDINVDTDNDGKADLNIAIIKRWIPNKNCSYKGFDYDTGEGFTPILNIDTDGDGKPDRNVDTDGDGIPDLNVDADWFEKNGKQQPIGGANTGDNTKWLWWWLLLILTGITLIYSQYKKHQTKNK